MLPPGGSGFSRGAEVSDRRRRRPLQRRQPVGPRTLEPTRPRPMQRSCGSTRSRRSTTTPDRTRMGTRRWAPTCARAMQRPREIGDAGSRALRSRAAPVCLGPARLPVVSTEGLAIVRRQVSASSSAGAGPPPAPLAGSSSHRRKAASWGTCSRRTPAPACLWLSPTAVAPV